MTISRTIKLTAAATLAGLAVGVPSAAADDGCFDYRGAVAGWGQWATSTSSCGVFGSPGHRVGYAWAIQPGTNTRICVEGYGYERYYGTPGGTRGRWFSMGCGTSGSGTVPWGNVAATPKVRAKVQPGFLGGAYRWRH